jgi:hypothetical protein
MKREYWSGRGAALSTEEILTHPPRPSQTLVIWMLRHRNLIKLQTGRARDTEKSTNDTKAGPISASPRLITTVKSSNYIYKGIQRVLSSDSHKSVKHKGNILSIQKLCILYSYDMRTVSDQLHKQH